MTAQEQQNVETKVPDATSVQDIPQQPVQNTEKQAAPAKEHEEDPNWKAFREARKKDRAEREAAERRAAEKEAEATALKAAMEAAFAKQPVLPAYQQEETDEQRIERKVQEALAAREAQYLKQTEERERVEYPNRLRQTYADFNNVIAQENLDYLDYHYPEVSRPLQRLRDGYEKWSDIYLAVKKFVPNHSTSKREAAKAEANFNKPKSMSSPNLTQTQSSGGGAPILSEERKAANWERMQKTLKGIS